MSYVPASRQLGGVELSKSSDKASYQIKYYVLESELDNYIPTIGDTAEWAPEACSVTSYTKSWYGPKCWLLSINASPYDNSFINKKQSLDDFIKKSYSMQDMRLPAAWFGAWIATSSDCPQFGTDGKLSAGEKRFMNVSGAWSQPGDPIFFNATPYEVDAQGTEKVAKASASKGSASYSASPFITSGTQINISLIGQTVKAKLYNCSFYTKRLPQNITDFVGVSGEFSGDCRPMDAGTGRWKALSQRVENVQDHDGIEWTHVSREMLQAPLGLQWDPAKNGGTWKW